MQNGNGEAARGEPREDCETEIVSGPASQVPWRVDFPGAAPFTVLVKGAGFLTRETRRPRRKNGWQSASGKRRIEDRKIRTLEDRKIAAPSKIHQRKLAAAAPKCPSLI